MKRQNPYWKYVKCETLLHHQVCSYVKHACRDIKIHHSPNESKRSPFERFLISIMGVSTGFPDLMLCSSRRNLFIELKYEKNIPSQNQRDWLKRLNGMLGSSAYVCWTYEAAVKIINKEYTGIMTDDHNNEYDDKILVYQGMQYLESDSIPAKFLETNYEKS